LDERPDDVDRLYAHLGQLPPPRDFAANVLLAARQRRSNRRTVVWAVAAVAAIIGLALVAFSAGQALVGGGALALVGAAMTNADVVSLDYGDVLLALAVSIPWIELLGVVVGAWIVARCAGELARTLATLPPAAGAGSAS
jgi:hypothetical protein